ncbi:MAG: hypothetical protein AABY85_09240 [Gemmatimonadota bacterium]
MRSNTSETARGFVLPTTLLVTTLLTVMLTAAFILVSAEHRTTDNSLAGARALSLAQAGLQSYLAANRGIGSTTTYDSVRYTVRDGYSDVVAQRLRPATGSSMAVWVIRSGGYSTDPRLGGQTQGKRVVAQLAQLNPGSLPGRAAMVAINGVQMFGGNAGDDNPIVGKDIGSDVTCTGKPGDADTTGLSVYAGGYGAGVGDVPNGGIEYLASAAALLDSTRIDWASLLAGNFVPDYTIPGGSWPTPGASTYNVGYVIGDATIPSSPGTWTENGRRGMLVVTGNVVMAHRSHWDGIIIAGGRLDTVPSMSANHYIIDGMIITGLNGAGVPRNQVRFPESENRRIRWAWCYALASVSALSAMVPIPNGWVDTWTTY